MQTIQWTGKNTDEVISFIGSDRAFVEDNRIIIEFSKDRCLQACINDFIVKTDSGEIFVSKILPCDRKF